MLAGLHPCSHGSARPGSSRDLTPPPAAQSGGQKVTSPAQIESLQRTLEDVLGPRRQLARSASKRPKVGEGVAAAADQKKALLYNLMGAPSGCMRGGGGGRTLRAAGRAAQQQRLACPSIKRDATPTLQGSLPWRRMLQAGCGLAVRLPGMVRADHLCMHRPCLLARASRIAGRQCCSSIAPCAWSLPKACRSKCS